jgi:alpha-mannosidase
MYSNYQTNFLNVQPSEFVCRYSLASFGENDDGANAARFGHGVVQPPVGVWMKGPRDGSLPGEGSFIEVDAENINLLCLKRAEDGDGLIVRLVETEGRATTASIRLPWVPINEALETDLVERNGGELSCDGDRINVPIRPWAMKTVRVRT